MTDWENDPELKALREEFVDSLPAREKALVELLKGLQAGNGDLSVLQRLAHTLAGAAGSYGYPELSEAAGRLEDLILGEAGPVETGSVLRTAEKLLALLRDPYLR